MRRRITVAILAVVIGTLVLTVAGSVFLVRRAAFQTTDNEITTEAEAIGAIIAAQPKFAGAHQLDALRRIGAFDRLRLVRLSALDVTARIPAPLSAPVLNVPALDAGQTVAGNVGDVVFVARPIVVPGGIAGRLGENFVLVATRQVSNPVNGIGYFVLVAGVVLVAGIVVAAVLARRFSAPITRAVEATRQIADGNLAATVPVRRNESAELAALAEAINTLGANLYRAQGLEREFFLSVSHELRTPLTSIRGYADAVAEGATDDISGAIGIIGSEARRLERLVQDLLDLARLQARQFSLHPQRVDGAALVRASVEGFQPGARAQGITLTSAGPDGPGPWVDTDPDRLSQVVANLVENALKFATARRGDRRPTRGGLGGRVGERRRRRRRPRRPAAHLRAPLHLGPRRATAVRVGLGSRHRGRAGVGHGWQCRRPVTAHRRRRHPRGAVVAGRARWRCGRIFCFGPGSRARSGPRVRLGRADVGASPPPPCVGEAPKTSAQVRSPGSHPSNHNPWDPPAFGYAGRAEGGSGGSFRSAVDG